MKKFTFYLFILTILFSTQTTFSQQVDSLIELSPGIGKRISSVDKEYYELFPQIKGFDKAELFIRENKFLVSNISYFTNKMQDTLLVQPLSILDSLRAQINRIQEVYDRKLEAPLNVQISLVNGERYAGKLEMFSKKYLYLFSDHGVYAGGTTHLRVKIPVSDVQTVLVPGESTIPLAVGIGALAGAIIGVAIGVSAKTQETKSCLFKVSEEEKSVCLGFLAGSAVAGVGALIGLVVGLSTSTTDKLIGIDTLRDVIKLKEYAKYNPGDIVTPGVKYFTIESL